MFDPGHNFCHAYQTEVQELDLAAVNSNIAVVKKIRPSINPDIEALMDALTNTVVLCACLPWIYCGLLLIHVGTTVICLL